MVEFDDLFMEDCPSNEAIAKVEALPYETRVDVIGLFLFILHLNYIWYPVFVSGTVLSEVLDTHDPVKKKAVFDWAVQYFQNWIDFGDEDLANFYYSDEFESEVRRNAKQLFFLKGETDRRLLAEAFVLRCDTFLTFDRKSLWKKRHLLKSKEIQILRPHELWLQINPKETFEIDSLRPAFIPA